MMLHMDDHTASYKLMRSKHDAAYELSHCQLETDENKTWFSDCKLGCVLGRGMNTEFNFPHLLNDY